LNSVLKYNLYNYYPEFIEGAIFKMVVPLDPNFVEVDDDASKNGGAFGGAFEGAFEGANRDGKVSKKMKEKLKIFLFSVSEKEGERVPYYRDENKLTNKTAERYIGILRKYNFIEFKGESPQTGGYFITEHFLKKIKKPLTKTN